MNKKSGNMYKNVKKMSPITTKNATPKNPKMVQPTKKKGS